MDKIEKAMRRAAEERERAEELPLEPGIGSEAEPVEASRSPEPAPGRRPPVGREYEPTPIAPIGAPDEGDEEAIKPRFEYTHSRVQKADDRRLRQNRIICDSTPQHIVNAYKMLRTQVLQRLERHGMSTVAVVSARSGEGRSLISVNLGLSIARDTQHTALLVDLDLRRPGLHTLFGLRPEHGLEEHLLQGLPLPDAFVNPGVQRFLLLPALAPLADSSELLASRRVGEFVEELKMRYHSRVVIFDLPPLLETDDVLSFLPHVDAVLLVASNGRTRKADLTRALDLLGDKPIVGTVLNHADGR